MRIAVFSDIHGNYQALDAIMKHIKKNKIDKIIFLGDAVGLGPSFNECLKVLNNKDIIFIAGNHEIYYTKNIDCNSSLYEAAHNSWVHETINEKVDDSTLSYELELNNKKFLFFHYFLTDDYYPFNRVDDHVEEDFKKLFKKYNNYDYVFYGHIHEGRYDEDNNCKFYCIGSSGCTGDENTFYYVIDTNEELKIEKVLLKYNRKKFEDIIKESDYPDKEHIADKFFKLKL